VPGNRGGDDNGRLPNRRERLSISDDGRDTPALCNPAGAGPWAENDPFTGLQSSGIDWSRTTCASRMLLAWGVNLKDGGIRHGNQTRLLFVWPVRDGK